MCSVNDGIEDATHLLLSCQLYTDIRIGRMNSVCCLAGTNVTDLDKQALVKLLLFGNVEKYSFGTNKRILLSTITYVKNSNHF